MKLIAAVILSGLLIFLGTQIYAFLGKEKALQKDFSDLKARLDAAKLDEAKLQADLNYYLNPANLEKELRARFNYKAPDEKLLILVPRNNSTTASSTNNP